MNTLVVYESMFGNTRKLAEAIADALEASGSSVTLSVASAAPQDLAGYDLVVIGAPTHAHTLPQPTSRAEAVAWAEDATKELTLEADAGQPGVREWIENLAPTTPTPRFAAYSTRADIPRIFAGDAAASMNKRLRRHGADIEAHADFLVDLRSHLVSGEDERAREWATRLIPVPTR